MGAKALNFEFRWCLGPGAWAAQGLCVWGGACVCGLRSPSATPAHDTGAARTATRLLQGPSHLS